MTKKKPTIPAELPPARPLPDVVVPERSGPTYTTDKSVSDQLTPTFPTGLSDGDQLITPYGGHIYNQAKQRWEPAEPPIRATLERIDQPQPVGWVPTPPDADTPFFNEVNANPPTPPHRCGPRDDHPHRWEALLAAAQADTAAIRKHFTVTMANSTL